MNAQTESTANIQAVETAALEDKSLPASETLRERQADDAETLSAPVFIP